jgi:hypothetical protein
MILRARARYEVGQTVLHFDKLTAEEREYITEHPFEYYYPNEHSGKTELWTLRRNSVIAKKIQARQDGYYVTVELDVNCLSTSKRKL